LGKSTGGVGRSVEEIVRNLQAGKTRWGKLKLYQTLPTYTSVLSFAIYAVEQTPTYGVLLDSCGITFGQETVFGTPVN